MTSSKTVVGIGIFALLVLAAPSVRAAPPFVDRNITLPRSDWAFDFGFGINHFSGVPGDRFGPGFNIDGAGGVTRGLELGLRTGLRLNWPARADGPYGGDTYARPFDNETYGTGNDVVANPEFHIRGALVEGDVVELGLEGRANIPFDRPFMIMPALPLAFHFGHAVRLDTGVYMPIFFYPAPDDRQTSLIIDFPFHLWIQATDQLWLGPLLGIRVHASANYTEIPLGFGLGYSITRTLDLKTWLLFQDVTRGPDPGWGLGVGLQVRIE